MTVREYISKLQELDQEKNIWVMYDPPYAVMEPEVTHLVGDNMDYVEMFYSRGVKEGDYAIIVG
jgi:hypothetical protein